ncbi:uncharacterized protein J7T55_012314 [Diaporthe amygdali]|uniref:uncharacterized protein n=1 Tax=Phomopsis amygdali TaxID=1214568 RepID=UPI0022FDD0C9|nr:uncharacterized protein J7T55_012314 [Diaporthe amygdali]KAJ0123844.1 uncharacterized protein J7T55_012314 [Diaporthe amygdali]
MSSSSGSDSGSDSGDEATFGRLLNIAAADLVALGSRIRELLSKTKTSNGSLSETFSGSFNLVHILQLDEAKMVIRIPTTGQFGDLPGPAKEALESQVHTLKYIKEHTGIPVPEVFHFDTTANNEIGAPYIAMSYISGRTVSRLWFDASGPTPLEERRQTILKQLAQTMSQLNKLRFDKIGSLVPSSQGSDYELGPCYEWDEAEDESISITSSGPFLTTKSFLEKFWAPTNEQSEYAVGAAKVLEEMLPFLPQSTESTYVLALPDFDSQNIMADDQGNITGLIDWDNVQTVPGFMGCLRYPGWITRDWDPLMYAWPQDNENSPDELQKYRAYYLQEIKQALEPQGSEDYRLTEKSHIYEAFWIAVANVGNRTSICQKFVDEAKRMVDEEEMPDGLDQDALNVLFDIAEEELEDEDWESLRKGLEALMTSEQ